MKNKIKVGIVFGGRSAEHEVSLQSAKNIIEAIDKTKYEVILIGIDKGGQWHLNKSAQPLLNAGNPKLIALNQANTTQVGMVPTKQNTAQLINLDNHLDLKPVDVVFPVLHGTYGEDGSIQGLLKLLNVPFVGCSILASSLGMDKDVQKRLLRDAQIPVAKFLTFTKNGQMNKFFASQINFKKVKDYLGLPLFIKPANLGSSVGVNKVNNQTEFAQAIKEAFKYDNKILIEEAVKGREIECSVLGNQHPVASLPGEVIPTHEFYSYEAKYIDENGAILQIPARLPQHIIQQIQQTAIKTFKTLYCEGMARVDMFLKEDREVLVNEINTIPGFTKISMYPKLWEISGLPYPKLIDKLIQLAIERFKKENHLKTSFNP